MILGGDLNTIFNPNLDKSSPKYPTPPKMAQALLQFMSQYGLVDVWQHLHPADKQFSFYSHVHKTHSRIDNFVIDKTLLPLVTTSEYQARVISNLSPLTLDFMFVSSPRDFVPGGLTLYYYQMKVLLHVKIRL